METVLDTSPAPVEYRSLYDMLDRFPYILANSAEDHLEHNWPLYEALSEWSHARYASMSMEEAQNYYDAFKLGRDLNEGEKVMTVEKFCESCSDSERQKIEDALNEVDNPDVYQTYIVDEQGAEILKDYGEIVWYNDGMGLHFWGVTHWGTAWSMVMDKQFPVRNHEFYRKY